MKRNFLLGLTVLGLLSLAGIQPCQAYVPMITVLLVDGTGSITQDDFNLEKVAAVKFGVFYYARSQVNPLARSDWLAINFFGNRELYAGTETIKCDDEEVLAKNLSSVVAYPHPKSDATAIYTAIARALLEANEIDKKLPGEYIKNIIVVTDGLENQSDPQMKELVRKSFPNNYVNLFMVGVGKDANLKEFEDIADICLHIDNYDALLKALVYIGQMLELK
jgi:hypothetical protein